MEEHIMPFCANSVDYCVIEYNKMGHPVEDTSNMKPAIIYNRRIYHSHGGFYYYNNYYRVGINPKWNITRWKLDDSISYSIINKTRIRKYKFLNMYHWTKYLIYKYSCDGIDIHYNHCNLRYTHKESGLSYYSRNSSPYYIRGLQLTEDLNYGKYTRGDIKFQFRDKRIVAIFIKNKDIHISQYMPLISSNNIIDNSYYNRQYLRRKIVYFRDTNKVHRDISYFTYYNSTIFHGDYRIYHKNGNINIQAQYHMGELIGDYYRYNRDGSIHKHISLLSI
jgi:hypothetical protein